MSEKELIRLFSKSRGTNSFMIRLGDVYAFSLVSSTKRKNSPDQLIVFGTNDYPESWQVAIGKIMLMPSERVEFYFSSDITGDITGEFHRASYNPKDPDQSSWVSMQLKHTDGRVCYFQFRTDELLQARAIVGDYFGGLHGREYLRDGLGLKVRFKSSKVIVLKVAFFGTLQFWNFHHRTNLVVSDFHPQSGFYTIDDPGDGLWGYLVLQGVDNIQERLTRELGVPVKIEF